MHHSILPTQHAPAHGPDPIDSAPESVSSFMSNMDEITYWVYTKRAPCLFNFDSLVKKEGLDVHYPKPKSIYSFGDDVPSSRKKKRKLSLLDDESGSNERHQNVYFDVSNIKSHQFVKDESESDTGGSNLDFNVKKSSVQDQRKRTKLQRSRGTLHKKNKVVTSTPKPNAKLRRSLRKANCLNNNSQLNSSFEILNVNASANHKLLDNEKKTEDKFKKSDLNGDQMVPNKTHNEKSAKKIVVNDRYDDLSDVSGFTANYIRSTKLHSSKMVKKPKGKANRNIMRDSQHILPKEENRMIVCMNKSVNTGLLKPDLNCSTDSSQNIVNLVTMKSNSKPAKVHKSTSLLKFIDSKTTNNTVDHSSNNGLDTNKDADRTFPSIGSSRYPKRHKNNPTNISRAIDNSKSNKAILDRRRKAGRNPERFSSDRKENPKAKSISRTRNGRGLLTLQPENSVLVFSNEEQGTTHTTVNVASPPGNQQCNQMKKKKRMSLRQMELAKKSMDNCNNSRRESLRGRSGYAACFSDSDDSEPLRQKKFFG